MATEAAKGAGSTNTSKNLDPKVFAAEMARLTEMFQINIPKETMKALHKEIMKLHAKPWVTSDPNEWIRRAVDYVLANREKINRGDNLWLILRQHDRQERL